MPEPVVLIIRFKIKEGKAADFRIHYQDSIQQTLDTKPGTLSQLAFENEDATVFTVIRHFPNPDALDLHLQGADERTKKSFKYIEPFCIEKFGSPNLATLEIIKNIASTDVSLSISPNYIGGFIR